MQAYPKKMVVRWTFNAYDWSNDSHIEWILRFCWPIISTLIEKAESRIKFCEFHKGVWFVYESLLFGMIIDLWRCSLFRGLRGDEGAEFFDAALIIKEDIIWVYFGRFKWGLILFNPRARRIFSIQPKSRRALWRKCFQWRKKNSPIHWRWVYYMRISSKEPGIGRGRHLERNYIQCRQYHDFWIAADDAAMAYVGNTGENDSWPTNTKFGHRFTGSYFRIKMQKL